MDIRSLPRFPGSSATSNAPEEIVPPRERLDEQREIVLTRERWTKTVWVNFVADALWMAFPTLAASLYGLSLALPAVHDSGIQLGGGGTYLGIECLVVGFFWSWIIIAWWSNLVFLIGMIFLFRGYVIHAACYGSLALWLGFTFVLFDSSSKTSASEFLRIGYWSWLASFGVLSSSFLLAYVEIWRQGKQKAPA